MTWLSPARRLASAPPVAISQVRLPRRPIIVASLCVWLALIGCESSPSNRDLEALERGLARQDPARESRARGQASRPDAAPGCRLDRFEAPAAGRAGRVVLDLTAEVPVTRREHARDGGGHVLALELEGVACAVPEGGETPPWVQRDDARSVVRVEADAAHAITLVRLGRSPRFVLDVAPRVTPSSRLVVLDPGHGGAERGARGAGELDEARLAFDVAERAAAWLTRYDPSVRAVLTRASDTALPTLARAARANVLGAAAFVSIHASATAPGVATYVLDPVSEVGGADLAATENGGEGGEPLTVPVGASLVASRVEAAKGLAEAVHNRVYRGARNVAPGLANRGIHRAPLHVLVGAAMPAVLVELGALGEPADAGRLADARVRDAMGEGIARGLVRYLAAP